MRKYLLAALLLLPGIASAQFVNGQVLTAAQLNSAFAAVLPLAGGTLTGPLTAPSATFTSPLGFASGGTGANTATGATSSLQYLAPFTGAAARSLTNKFQDILNLKDFGAQCNGVSNDDAAMTSAFADLTANSELILPAGVCVFTTAKTMPMFDNIAIVGAGSGATDLLYEGTNTTNDLITIGNGSTPLTGWQIQGFRVDSTTTMTGGSALHIKLMQATNTMTDVSAGTIDGATKLWNGPWLDDVNVFKYTHFSNQVQNAGVMMNGAAGSAEGSDVFLDYGVVQKAAIGYLVGGGIGGIYFGKVLSIDNGVNYQIDNSLVANGNREIYFSDQAISDANKNYGIWINDTYATESPIRIEADIGSAGTYATGGVGVNVYVQSWPNGRIAIGPGQLDNATSDAVRVSDPTTVITVEPGRHIFSNGGYAINATVADSNIYNYAQFMASNTSGNLSSNVTSAPFAGSFDHELFYVPGQQRGIAWVANGNNRWREEDDGSAETGSNAGSNLIFANYSDSGTYLGSPLTIYRNSGVVAIANGLQVQGTFVYPNLSGTTASIGGSALAAGACSSGTVSVTGSTTSMAVDASPVTYPGDGNYWRGYVSSAGTVTVKVCASVAATPTASTYNVRVLQ